MIKIEDIESILIESLKHGLSEFITPDNITIEEHIDTIQNKDRSISLINTGFTTEELGIGDTGGVKNEEIIEKFNSDGKNKDFKLSQQPLHAPIIVESPIGVIKTEPDDYTINYAGCIILFRKPPEKGDVQIKYYIVKAVAEIRELKFIFDYSIIIHIDDLSERKKIAFQVVKTLYRERSSLANKGIDIQLIKGYQNEKKYIIDYQIETVVQIDIPLPAIDKIEISI